MMSWERPVGLFRQLKALWTKVEALEAAGPGEGGAAGVSSFNTRSGAVTLGPGDVTGALGFTPEPSGDYAAADHNHTGVYALASHNHLIADVSGLQTALDGKQASGSYSLASHNHDGVYALAAHSHSIANVTGLQAALDGKAASSHSHVIADVTGLQSALDGKQAAGSYALASHSHSDATVSVSGFMSAADKTKLNGVATAATANDTDANLKARANHTGTQAASTISDFSEAVDDRVSALLLQGSNISLSYNDGANSLTVSATGGGADPWTYVKLANDFTTSSATAVDVTGMAFTPAANTSYEFEAHLMTRTATATVGPRPGVAWPTGGSDGVASIYTPSSGTAETMVHGNISAALLAAVGGLPNTTSSYGAKVQGIFVAGASPSGTVKVQLASETAGTNVTVKAGSFLKYRSI